MMRKRILAVAMILLFTVVTTGDAFARMGGGRSSGSRGSRTMSAPTRPYSPPGGAYSPPSTPPSSTYRQDTAPQAPPPGGGFLRNFGAGMLGGLLGSMLGGGSGCGSRPDRRDADPYGTGSAGQGTSGGGIGFLDILLLAVAAFLLFRFLKKRQARRQDQSPDSANFPPPLPRLEPEPSSAPFPPSSGESGAADARDGIRKIRQMDPSFGEESFGEQATDLFFRLQGAWTRRDLSSARDLLTGEMRGVLQADIDGMKGRGQVNRLENIAVRSVEIVEAWQESGMDYVTVRFLASLLDYTTDEAGNVLEGSDAVPVKFEEYWTLTRPVGPGGWKLSAIQQP